MTKAHVSLKNLMILGMLMGFSLSALAGEGGKEAAGVPGPDGYKPIYEKLKAPEKDISQGLGVQRLQKALGGLSCEKGQVVYPGAKPTYICELAASERDDGVIYDALDVPERDITPPGIMGHATFLKAVGRLTCTRGQSVVPHPVPSYFCKLHDL